MIPPSLSLGAGVLHRNLLGEGRSLKHLERRILCLEVIRCLISEAPALRVNKYRRIVDADRILRYSLSEFDLENCRAFRKVDCSIHHFRAVHKGALAEYKSNLGPLHSVSIGYAETLGGNIV